MMRAIKVFALLWLLAIALATVAAHAGLRLNTSASVPRGLYWLSARPSAVGGYVAVCPPRWRIFEQARARGYLSPGPCAGNYGQMIKVLAARPGNAVRFEAEGVRIDGRLWPASAPLHADATGWLLPQLAGQQTTLGKRSVLVMSRQCEVGFDSRYFGALPSAAIVATATPLLTW